MTTLADLISDSIATNSIIHTTDADLREDLLVECDGGAEYTSDEDGVTVEEFWGADADGREWRIHLEVRG